MGTLSDWISRGQTWYGADPFDMQQGLRNRRTGRTYGQSQMRGAGYMGTINANRPQASSQYGGFTMGLPGGRTSLPRYGGAGGLGNTPAARGVGAYRGGGGGGASSYINQMIQAQNRANAANQRRYQQALAEYNTMIGEADQFGQFEGQMIDRRTQQGKGSDAASLRSRGLYNSTIYDTMMRGRDFDAQLAKQALSEQVLGRKHGYRQQRAGVRERRTDSAGDMGMIAQLMQSLGYAGGGGGGGRAPVPRRRNYVPGVTSGIGIF